MEIDKAGPSKIIVVYTLCLGLFELVSGLGIFFFGKSLLGIYENLKNAELVEDSNVLLVKLSESIIPNLFAHRYLIGLFLFALGIIKLVSAIGLLYNKEWAEYLLIIFLTLLIPFDLYGEILHFTLFKTIYLTINIFIVLYLMRFRPVEYQKKLRSYIKK